MVAPADPTQVAFAAAAAMVSAIWADLGLLYPPAVEKLPRQATRTVAKADRLCLYLPDELPSWCLLHELAHALSSTQDGKSDGHGPIFTGLYVQLLVRYLRLDRDRLLNSLRDCGIAADADAKPLFL